MVRDWIGMQLMVISIMSGLPTLFGCVRYSQILQTESSIGLKWHINVESKAKNYTDVLSFYCACIVYLKLIKSQHDKPPKQYTVSLYSTPVLFMFSM